tara:strand:- start:9056 stop:9214 length:159 start_codon:yes stop_codon:yes gene_type:complete
MSITFIPDEITNDAEMLSWLEEQSARVSYEAQQAFSDIGFDEENHEPLWGSL